MCLSQAVTFIVSFKMTKIVINQSFEKQAANSQKSN